MSRSNVKVTGDKNEQLQHFVPESFSGAQSSCGIFLGAVLGGTVLHQFDAGGKISACCLVLCLYLRFCASQCVLHLLLRHCWLGIRKSIRRLIN